MPKLEEYIRKIYYPVQVSAIAIEEFTCCVYSCDAAGISGSRLSGAGSGNI